MIQQTDTQPDFSPLHEASYQQLLSEQPLTLSDGSCIDLAAQEQPDLSPLFVAFADQFLTLPGHPSFSGLVEESKVLWYGKNI